VVKKLYIGLLIAVFLLGIATAGLLATKIIVIDTNILKNADNNRIDYTKYTYKETIDGDYSTVCIYHNGTLSYPCTKVLTKDEDSWIADRIGESINSKVTDKSKSNDEGVIVIESTSKNP
jgi:hypothetical protein